MCLISSASDKMRTFLLTTVLLLVAIAGMAVTILVKPGGKFPDGEISHNKGLRKEGIICAKEEELRIWGRRGNKRRHTSEHPLDCPPEGCDACAYSKPVEEELL